MDSSGKSVNSSSGEHFFIAENMTFGEVYTKDIQIMNLCDDKAYNIYFSVEPKPESKKGEIDLEAGCVCSFYLDGQQFYTGNISGIGNINLSEKAYDLGFYELGSSHTLSCSIAWVNSQKDLFIDEGHKLVDKTGEWFLIPRNGDKQINGEIEFKWIFYAAVDADYVPPKTGMFFTNSSIWLYCIVVVSVMLFIMIILIAIKKKKSKKKVRQ